MWDRRSQLYSNPYNSTYLLRIATLPFYLLLNPGGGNNRSTTGPATYRSRRTSTSPHRAPLLPALHLDALPRMRPATPSSAPPRTGLAPSPTSRCTCTRAARS